MDDGEVWFSSDFEQISGIKSELLLTMEQAIFKLLNFKINITEEECRDLMPEFFQKSDVVYPKEAYKTAWNEYENIGVKNNQKKSFDSGKLVQKITLGILAKQIN